MDWIYPDVIKILKAQCECFLNKEIDVLEIQSDIYKAEQQILAIEEKWLKDLLFQSENEIELKLYTIDSDKLISSVEPIVRNILSKINS